MIRFRKVPWKQIIAASIVAGMFSLQGFTIAKQQDIIDTLLDVAISNTKLDLLHDQRIWDLHRRVVALEAEDQRIMAHVRWFVMRRSGTNELRRMEAAISRLEAE